jgi:tripartite-type tricarboxylate transporter receptor subunit TctC
VQSSIIFLKGLQMKFKIFALISLCLSASISWAASTYTLIVPNPPGSTSDLVARTIADEYTKATGNTIVFDYVNGAAGIIGVTKFKNCTTPCITVTGLAVHVLNYFQHDNLPYSGRDFDHVSWVGWSTNVWYVNFNSSIRNIDDLMTKVKNNEPINIGVEGPSSEINADSLKKMYPTATNINVVRFRGSAQLVTAVAGGHVDVGINSPGGATAGLETEGRIRFLGVTHSEPVMINGKLLQPVDKVFKAAQFDGAMMISVSVNHTSRHSEVEQLKKDLLTAVRSSAVKEKLSPLFIYKGYDGSFAQPAIDRYKQTIIRLGVQPVQQQ